VSSEIICRLGVSHQFLPKTPSVRTSQVMDQFGVNFDSGCREFIAPFDLAVPAQGIVLLTGESGSGKSSLLRTLSQQLQSQGKTVLDLAGLPFEQRCLIDALPVELDQAEQLLAQCGLGEAHLMLRRPQELSDGQQCRFRLAVAVAQRPDFVLIDEFTATLDRPLAFNLSAQMQRLRAQYGCGFLLATTHADIVDAVAPDCHLHCRLDGTVGLERVDPQKKSRRLCREHSGSVVRPSPTGRTSLGGIIEATASGCCGKPSCCGMTRTRSESACSLRLPNP